ncbi:hypothetical protein [Aliamphritea spongicola]|uniref:hypothetical protein n=1 Tax=Aliamphritea spongicola TaxID=707589 RepID=UPI00196A4CC7|nr:hypothetical protein [Aliamphritea spongicola]MBN3563693.1 hypothetical protein [Aliamphritea spongicola]
MRQLLILTSVFLLSACMNTQPPQPQTRVHAVTYSPDALAMSARSMLNGEIRALNRHLENIYYTAEQPEAPVSIKVTALKREEDWKLGYQPVSWIVRGTANVLARADDAISYQTHLWVTVSNGVKSRDYYIEGGHFTKQEKAFYGKDFPALAEELQEAIDDDF